jgi:nucleotide-binding universal stress UspA family protein
MYNEILVPLDGSELSRTALPHARELAKAFGAHITLLAVIEPPVAGYYWATDPYSAAAARSAVEWQESREIEMAERFLQETCDNLKADGVDATYRILEDDPGSAICDCAQSISADLIVMSTHGRSGISRWVYGSVAEKVLRGSSAPVLLVRAHRHVM